VPGKPATKSTSSASTGARGEASAGTKVKPKDTTPAVKSDEPEEPAEQMALDMEIEEEPAKKKTNPRRRPAGRRGNKLSTVTSVKKAKK
jgi:hypothetical protein